MVAVDAALLQDNECTARVIEPEQRFETGEDGSLRVRGKTIRDRRPFGVLKPADVLRLSSNVGAVLVAQAMGRETQHQGLLRFGFGRSTGSGFPVEASGILRDWRFPPLDAARRPLVLGAVLAAFVVALGYARATFSVRTPHRCIAFSFR